MCQVWVCLNIYVHVDNGLVVRAFMIIIVRIGGTVVRRPVRRTVLTREIVEKVRRVDIRCGDRLMFTIRIWRSEALQLLQRSGNVSGSVRGSDVNGKGGCRDRAIFQFKSFLK